MRAKERGNEMRTKKDRNKETPRTERGSKGAKRQGCKGDLYLARPPLLARRRCFPPTAPLRLAPWSGNNWVGLSTPGALEQSASSQTLRDLKFANSTWLIILKHSWKDYYVFKTQKVRDVSERRFAFKRDPGFLLY